MYLSKLTLDARSSRVRRDLSDCHDLHRTVMSGFPDLRGSALEGARRAQSVLHRVDISDDGHRVLLVQSETQPDWSRLPDGYLLVSPGVDNPACKQISRQYVLIGNGMVLSFRLRANPTKKIDTKSGPDGQRRNGRRVELRRVEDQEKWLMRKGAMSGFEVLDVRTSPGVLDVRVTPDAGVRTVATVRGGRRDGSVTVGAVLYEGHLRVTDAELLRTALRLGLGPAKAYGCGLLSVGPPRRDTA